MKWWNKWNRTEGGYERTDTGMLISMCICVALLAGMILMGVMLK